MSVVSASHPKIWTLKPGEDFPGLNKQSWAPNNLWTVKLPPLAKAPDSGTVVNLFVKEGDQITKDQAILELENEKDRRDDSVHGGWHCHKVYVKERRQNQRRRAHPDFSRCGWRGCSGKTDCGSAQGQTKPAPAPKTEEPKEESSPAVSAEEVEKSNASVAAKAPSIRKLARDLGSDLTRIRGSTPGGRITTEDVRNYIQRLQRLASQPKSVAGGNLPPESSIF